MKCPFVIKVCTKCGKLLVANKMNFHKSKTGKYGLEAKCKECYKEEKLDYNKKYQQTHKEELIEYRKEWYLENKDEIREKRKQHRLDNPHIIFNANVKKYGVNSNITKEQYYEILEYFGYKCAYCDCDLDENNTTLDHIIPLSKGGATDPWYIVPCCRSCNASKRDKNYLLWLDGKEMLDKYEMLSRYVEFMFDKYNK